jgi:integrase
VFDVAAAQFLEDKKNTLRPKTLRGYRSYLTGRHFKPLHRLPLAEITRAQIREQISRLIEETGRPTAREAAKTLYCLYEWTIDKEMFEGQNPVRKTDVPKKSKPRDRVLGDDEIRAIWLACDARAAVAPSKQVRMRTEIRGGGARGQMPLADVSPVVQLLFLTGCRSNEIGRLTWDEINWKDRVLELAPARTKTDMPLYLPLVDTALDILKRVVRHPEKNHVFGVMSDSGISVARASRINDFILRMGGEAPRSWTIHDIRRTMRTRMAQLGIKREIAERVVNHVGHLSPMEATYNQYDYEHEIRDALEQWEKYLLSIVYGTEQRLSAPLPFEVGRPIDRAVSILLANPDVLATPTRDSFARLAQQARVGTMTIWRARKLIEGGSHNVIPLHPPMKETAA